jgi:hypothetical protein
LFAVIRCAHVGLNGDTVAARLAHELQALLSGFDVTRVVE